MRELMVEILGSFMKVAELAGADLSPDDIEIEFLPAPHKPTGLPVGKMAVYVFSYKGTTLKVGKAGPNSDARFRSQHYNAKSAPSTLAASLLKDPTPIGSPQIEIDSVGDWIRQHTDRANFLLSSKVGIEVLTLLEAFIQCSLSPVYEGFAAQR